MNTRPSLVPILIVLLLICAPSCYPVKQVTSEHPNRLGNRRMVTPTKVYLHDGTVHLFQDGFVSRSDSGGRISGFSTRFVLGEGEGVQGLNTIPYSSIAALHYYDRHYTVGRGITNFITGLYTAAIVPLSIYCLTCPKCCFGSCPTIYVTEGDSATLQAELFSHAISPLLADDDLDVLSTTLLTSGPLRLTMTNEALESHFIDKFSVSALYHPIGSQLIPSTDGTFSVFQEIRSVPTAVNSEGMNVHPLVRASDNTVYRSPDGLVERISLAKYHDYVEVTIPALEPEEYSLIVRYKNTLMSTVLLYDMVLGSQGIHAVEWTHRMSTDPAYASLFSAMYTTFSGITVEILEEGTWQPIGRLEDPGPLSWKSIAIQLPESGSGERRIRLKYIPDNMMIDFIGYGSRLREASVIESALEPTRITDGAGQNRADIQATVSGTNGEFLINEPGDSYVFEYDVDVPSSSKASFVVRSHGYYYEWIRGGWLTRPQSSYTFALPEVDKTLRELSSRWLRDREEIESMFFQTRIPLRRKQ